MAYTRDQLMQALRRADAAGDTEAATAIARRIKSMDIQANASPDDGLTVNVTDFSGSATGKAKAATGAHRKPKSFWQGAAEGLEQTAENATSYLENLPIVGTPMKGAAALMTAMGVLKPTAPRPGLTGIPSPSLSRGARAGTASAVAESPYRSSPAGKLAGQFVGATVAGGIPGVAKQGALGGALITDDPENPATVSRDALIGAAGTKAFDLGLRGAGKVLNRPAKQARQGITTLAERLGVRPTPATTGGALAQIMQTGIGATPGGYGPVAKGVMRETDDLAEAAHRAAQSLGPVSTPRKAGENLVRGAKAFRTATSREGSRLYSIRTERMGGERAPVLLGSAAREIQTFADDFPNTPLLAAMREHPAVRKLGQALPEGAAPELTVKEATEALSHIRAALRNAQRSNTVTPAIAARIGQVERALEGDVVRAAQASDAIAGRAGAESATAAQATADRFWAQRSQALRGPLKKAIDSADDGARVSAESVYRQVLSDMGREGGNMGRLRQTWKSLPQGARRSFAATAMDDLGRAKPGVQDAAGSEWSFQTFLTNYDKMAPEARKLVFGPAEQQFDDIARYASALRRTDKLRNYSNTARTYLAGAYLAGVGGQILEGDYPGAVKGMAALPAMAIGGKAFMASPAGRRWVRSLMATLATKTGAQQNLVLRRLTNQLPVLASKHPALKAEADAILRAVNDNLAAPLAAESEQQEQQRVTQP